jgi:hypothetical protein
VVSPDLCQKLWGVHCLLSSPLFSALSSATSLITFLAALWSVSTKELAFSSLLLLPDFFIPEKDGEYWEPRIYKGRDGRRDKRCFLSYCLASTCQRGGPTGKVNLITVSLNPHTQITASSKKTNAKYFYVNYC